MTTFAEPHVATKSLAEDLRTLLLRFADRLSDAYARAHRNARERFLSDASDVYELERLEREWDRRPGSWGA